MISARKKFGVLSMSLLRPVVFTFLLIALATAVFTSSITGQDVTDLAPPPLKLLSKDEKSRLAAQVEVKERTELALDLMNARLKSSEGFGSTGQFAEMYKELGSFHAIMDDTFTFLSRNNVSSSKVLKNLKKFEISLRSFAPRLENVRRELPQRYESYVRNLIKYIQETREKAIEPFYGNTVVPNSKNQDQ